MSPANYEFRGCVIPARMAPALQRWIEQGHLPGRFLCAVLCNDLREAVGLADAENLAALPAYIGYLYNEAPAACYGSLEKVAEWAGRFNGAEVAHGELSFELINQSDAYKFTAPSLEVAAQAVTLIGEGAYGGKSLDGGEDVPIFLFGGHDAWFTAHFGKTAEQSFETRDNAALAECFESFTLGGGRATSLNDIGGRAKAYAKALRAEAANGAAS